jgi:hypothetical protein
MPRYSVRYVHNISPRDTDISPNVELDAESLETRGALGAALRRHAVLSTGEHIRAYRVEPSGRIVAFPRASIWHSIILTPL